MPRKMTAFLLALVLATTLALPATAAPQGLAPLSWLEELVTEIVGAIEGSLSSIMAIESGEQTPEDTEERTDEDGREVEPVPDFWPGYDPVG
ncbi:MAG: hypothetical protein AAF368_12335 [Planctomycetota bacterium]